MFPRDLGYEFAILAVICTVAIFLFPMARGSYSAVHGPVTALLSLRAKLKLWLGIALAALHLLGRMQREPFASLLAAWQELLLPQAVPPGQISVLRC